ncbi:hypothetical protein Tco_1280617 [Tanacetum coccineum]
MENTNPPPTNNPLVLPTVLRTKVVKELQTILAYIDSRLENIDQFLNDFKNRPNKINIDDPELEDETVNTPLVSHFLDSDDDFDDGEVLSELEEYSNAGRFRRKKIINSFDGDDLAFYCMIGFRNTGMNLVAIVRNVCVFIGSFTYVTDFVVLEDIGEFILWEMAEVVMGKPFREVTNLDYDCAKGLLSFTMIFDNYMFQMPRTIPSIDVIDEILEEDFDALLDEGSEILHSIEGTILEEKLFAEFDEFMTMTTNEIFESKSDT